MKKSICLRILTIMVLLTLVFYCTISNATGLAHPATVTVNTLYI